MTDTLTTPEKFIDLFQRLGRLCALSAPEELYHRHFDREKCAGTMVTWAMSDGGAQYSYVEKQFPADGDKRSDPVMPPEERAVTDVPVFGGCAEEYVEGVAWEQLIGQSRTFLLLKCGWRPEPEAGDFSDLVTTALRVRDHFEWLKRIFGDINPVNSFTVELSGTVQAFDDESDMDEFKSDGGFTVSVGAEPGSMEPTLMLDFENGTVTVTAIDFDTLNLR